MTLGLDEPRGLAWQCADWAGSYSVPGSAMPASAFAMTASARSIAALSSSLFQASTEWPSSNDRSLASRERETNSRSAATASESSLASAPFREDCTSLSPSHRNCGPSNSIITKDNYCNCPRSHVCRLTRVWLCSGGGRSWRTPVPLQQFIETIDGLSVDHPLQHVTQIGIGFDVVELAGLDERAGDGPTMPAAIAACEQVVLAAKCHRVDRAFAWIFIEFNAAVMQEARQTLQMRVRVTDGFGQRTAAGYARRLGFRPSIQSLHDRPGEGAPFGKGPHSQKVVQDSDAYHALAGCGEEWAERRGQWGGTAAGRRDKRGSPVEPQAIDMAWVPPCRSVGARAVPCILASAIKGVFGTVCAFDRWEALP
jgi:hypothetical protein